MILWIRARARTRKDSFLELSCPITLQEVYMRNQIDLSGIRFGKLVVVSRRRKLKGNHFDWLCHCDCGKDRIIKESEVLDDESSCGCTPRTPRRKKRTEKPGAKRKYDKKFSSLESGLLSNYVNGCLRRGVDWKISYEYAVDLMRSPCFYCGEFTKRANKKESALLNGIDRVNNDLGYETGNVVSCCAVCNHAKHITPKEDFFSWIKRIYKHQNFS